MKKFLIQLILFAGIVALAWVLIMQFYTPLEFDKLRKEREEKVVERLVDIRTAQRAYRTKYSKFTPSFDSLVHFVLNDSLPYERATGSEDDSVAMAQGLVRKERMMMAVRDTISFTSVNLNSIDQLKVIPFSVEATGGPKQFVMDTTSIKTESSVIVPVFEAFAPYPTFLGDLDKQEVINFRDYRVKTLGRDDGLKVGSLTMTNNEAGNWE